MTNFFSPAPYSVVEFVSGSAILRVFNEQNGKFIAYTVQLGGKSFQTLKAARTYARSLR